MPATKKNSYEMGVNDDLVNVALNVDINRRGMDKVFCEVSGSDLLIKVGSIIESNGDIYVVDTADLVVALSDGYLVFDDSVPEFKIINSETAEIDEEKCGYYRPSPNETERVTRWDILGSEIFINEERDGYKPLTGTRKNEGDLDIFGKLLFSGASGAYDSGSIPFTLPAGMCMVELQGSFTISVVGDGGTVTTSTQSFFFGTLVSDGTNVTVAGTGTYELVEIG